ncbi:MAG: hypothetical protein ACRD5L_10550, partial [Bryobacteraceae bacterium]
GLYCVLVCSSLVVSALVAFAGSCIDNPPTAVCSVVFWIALPASFHFMYGSIPQIALHERFRQIAEGGEGPAQIPQPAD